MASGWNLWVWLECIGVVSGCCCKEVYGIALIFRGSLNLRISRVWNRSQNYFSENFDTSKLSHIGDVKDGSISVFQEGGWKLSRYQAT